MATAEDVIRVCEREEGSNSGKKYWEYFNGPGTYVDGWATPYCVDYARWCEIAAGTGIAWPHQFAWDETDRPTVGDAMVPKYALMPADALSFDWDGDSLGDHVGIVKSVHDWGVVTSEGNTSGGVVREQQRLWSVVICGIRPRLDGVPARVPLDVDGVAGRLTIGEWMAQMGMQRCDGVLSDQLWPHDRYRRGVVSFDHYALDHADWAYWGSTFVRAVQGRVGVAVDGDWGLETTQGVERHLRGLGYYKGPIDDDFGPGAVASLQESLNDGAWSR